MNAIVSQEISRYTVFMHTGLTSEEAAKRLATHGKNALAPPKRPTGFAIFVSQLKSPMVYILLTAAAVTFILRESLDTAVIMIAVIVNTGLGFLQEYKAERTLWALKQLITPTARVSRDGAISVIPAETLVPDDVVHLSPGDKIPADGMAVEAAHLYINEAILTGESTPVEKLPDKDQNALSMGTTVVSGRGVMTVTHTGPQTSLGKLAQTIGETPETETPLQHALSSLSRQLGSIVIVLCIAVFLLGILFGENLRSMFVTSVAIAVSAIPEGLVVSLTVILAVGMQRMMRRKALLRKLVAAETLGSVTAICVDKTGTITQGVMRVVESAYADKTETFRAAILANNLEDPMEVALWEWAQAQDSIDPERITGANPRHDEIPFDGVRKYMAVATHNGVYVKGAPEVLLSLSHLSPKVQTEWLGSVKKIAGRGLRTLALGYIPGRVKKISPQTLNKLTFLGVLGIADPVRTGVKEAIKEAIQAGVTVKIITGDFRDTAAAVMREVGLPITNPRQQIVEGKELSALTDNQLREKIKDVLLFCRVTPAHKLAIVRALQATGEVVAMTGDGVNDAMALKSADIGIVVSGASDIARETADMVLLDSNFRTITAAVEEGRGIFANLRKVILYLLSDVFVEILLIAAAMLVRLPLPLTARQILWINLIDDGLPNLALTIDPTDPEIMRSGPRDKYAPIVSRTMKILIALISVVTAALTFAVYVWAYKTTGDLHFAQTMTFTIVGVSSLMYIFSCRSLERSVFSRALPTNPWLWAAVVIGFALQLFALYHPWAQRIFNTYPLGLAEWIVVASVGILVIGIIETAKLVAPKLRKLIR